jgi:nucleoside-triphosphatase THEP1
LRKNILITGLPQSGKSTLLKKLILGLPNTVGFVTNEVLRDGARVGFEMEAHNGEKAMLASIGFPKDIAVSCYGVSLENLVRFIPEVGYFADNNFLYLDEIGEMQLHSLRFKKLVWQYLGSSNICLATISSVFKSDFVVNVKTRKDVIIVEITPGNREEKERHILSLIGKITKARRYLSEPERFSVKHDKATVKGDHETRYLDFKSGQWFCNCDFFLKNRICSHAIAVEEFVKQ